MSLPTLKSEPDLTVQVACDLNRYSNKPIYAVSDHTGEVVNVEGNSELEARVREHRDLLLAEEKSGSAMFQPLSSITCVTSVEIVNAEVGERIYREMMWRNAMGDPKPAPYLRLVR